MIIETFAQGSEEWKAARVGKPSASNFDCIITTRGDPSKQRKKYLYTLAGERIIGKKEEIYQNDAMTRGIQMESEARGLYDLILGTKTKQVGVCYQNEKRLIVASPDGLVGDLGLLEIKCPLLPTMVAYQIEDNLVMDYWQQLQGQLLVTGREWVDIMAYYPAMNPIIKRVERDDKFLKALEIELSVFCQELEEITKKLKGE